MTRSLKSPAATRALTALLAALALLGPAAAARADLVISAPDITVTPGQTGAFDILLVNQSSSTQSYTISGFSIDLQLPSTTSVAFTGISESTTASYIFSGISTFGFLGSVLNGGAEVKGNDIALSPATGVTLAPGTTVGLAHVTYSVAANAAAGTVPMSFISINAGTSLANAQGTLITLTASNLSNGSFHVVPEPSSLMMAAIGLGACGALAARIRSARTA